MLINKDNIIVSAYTSKYSKSPIHTNLLHCIFTREHKELIDELRSYEYHSEQYDEFKITRLPMWWNGIYYEDEEKTIDNIRIAPVIIIDIDLQDNPHLTDKFTLDDWKYELININSTICVALSCGGSGLFVVHRLDDNVTKENFIKYFKKLEKYYKDTYNIVVDESCKNPNRGRYVTYDDHIVYNQIYDQLTIDDEEELDIIDDIDRQPNYDIINHSIEYDINNSKSENGWYFGHSSNHEQNGVKVPLINSVICTLYSLGLGQDEICSIWKHPKFYNKKKNIEANIRWTKNFKIQNKETGKTIERQDWRPSLKTIKFLNEYCGFKIDYEVKLSNTDFNLAIDDWIFEIADRKNEIQLEDNEYLYDKRDELLKLTDYRINMWEAPAGRGKTTFFNKLHKDTGVKICIIQPYKSIVSSKYDETICNLCIEKNKIKPEYEYVVTHYNGFVDAYNKHTLGQYDYLVIDESHLLGTQGFRSSIILKCVDYVIEYIEENKNYKLILMTASPTNEKYLFDDKIHNIVKINFNDNRFISIHYMNIFTKNKTEYNGKTKEYYENYTYSLIENIIYLSNIAKEEGRKIYIYWGNGSINNDEIYRKAAESIYGLNIAIYHRSNEGGEDLEYIRNEGKIGKYDGMMSSCYFSVGCDLNDEEPAQVIIIGNGTYQDDYQVIQRFRKSKNIKVTILVDRLYIPKYDCGLELNNEILKSKQTSSAKSSRNTSLITKTTSDDNSIKKAYINTSQKYYSDIERKFKFFNKMNYHLFNTFSYDSKDKIYSINEITCEGNIPVIYLNDNKDDTVKRIVKERKLLIQDIECELISKLKTNPQFDLSDIYNANTKYPKLQDWIEGIMMIQHHYNINKILELDTDLILGISKKKLNSLVRWIINYKNNDKVENWIIERLIEKKEEVYDNDLIIPLYYITWCYALDKNNSEHSTYDLINKYNYPVYKNWKNNVIEILNVKDEVREILMEEIHKDNEYIIDEYTRMFFDLDNMNDDDKIEWIKNKYVNQADIIRFINNIVQKETNIKELLVDSGKIGGKIGGKKGKEIEIDGQKFNTVKEAAEKLHTSRSQIYRLIKK